MGRKQGSAKPQSGEQNQKEKVNETSRSTNTNTNTDSESDMESEFTEVNARGGRKRPSTDRGDPSTNSDKRNKSEYVLYIASSEINFSHVSSKVLSLMLEKEIEGRPLGVSVTRNGKLKLVCSDINQFNLAKRIQMFDKKKVVIEIPEDRSNFEYCFIYGIAPDYALEELKIDIIPSPQAVYRLNRQGQPSTTVKLGYTQGLPAKVHIGYFSYSTRPCSDLPVRCFKCQRYGHVATSCNATMVCPRCSGPHTYNSCPNQNDPTKVHCNNCGGGHSAAYAGCPIYREALEINKLKSEKKMTYAQAIKEYRNDHPPPPPPQPVRIIQTPAPAPAAPINLEMNEELTKLIDNRVESKLSTILCSVLDVIATTLHTALAGQILQLERGYSSRQVSTHMPDVIKQIPKVNPLIGKVLDDLNNTVSEIAKSYTKHMSHTVKEHPVNEVASKRRLTAGQAVITHS